jgi:transposase
MTLALSSSCFHWDATLVSASILGRNPFGTDLRNNLTCAGPQVSGGKVLFTKSRRVRSRVATALRMGAQSLHHAKDYLGEFFRRITRKLGRPQAITATAHKLARIVYHLLDTKEAYNAYNESVFHKSEADTIRRAEYRLRRQAAQLGFQIIPADNG